MRFRLDPELAPRYDALERAAAVAATMEEIEAVEREAQALSALLCGRRTVAGLI